MHAPRCEASTACALFFLRGCDSNRDERKQDKTIDSFLGRPAVVLTQIDPDNNVPDHECCAFHVRGEREVLQYGSG